MECIRNEVRFFTGITNFPFPKCADQVYIGRNKKVSNLDKDTDIIDAGDTVLIPVHESDNIEEIEDSLAVCLEEKYNISFVYRVYSKYGDDWRYNVIGFGKSC